MTDQQLWAAAAERITADCRALPQPLKTGLTELAAEIRSLKAAHQRVAASVDADRFCSHCRGECCRFGKHHFTIVDLLVFLFAGQELFSPDFDHPVCPYHSGAGCLMAPDFRPFNCIIFICEQLESGLANEARLELAAIESRLRQIYGEFDRLLGNRFANGLLITFRRALDSGVPPLNWQRGSNGNNK